MGEPIRVSTPAADRCGAYRAYRPGERRWRLPCEYYSKPFGDRATRERWRTPQMALPRRGPPPPSRLNRRRYDLRAGPGCYRFRPTSTSWLALGVKARVTGAVSGEHSFAG